MMIFPRRLKMFFKRLRINLIKFFRSDNVGEEEVNLRTLSIIFLLGLLLLFGSYFFVFDESKTVYNIPSSTYNKIVKSYNGLINHIRIFSIGQTETIDNFYETISCKDCKVNIEFKIKQDKKILVVDYELSHKSNIWRQAHKIFERVFKIPVDFGWVQLNKKLDYVDWREYTAISLSVKGAGKPSNLEFSILEEDGDEWYYFDKTSLASKDWVEIKMPFESFVNPEWASHGDGKKEFKGITQIALTITNFDKPVKNTLYFGLFDGKIFELLGV